MDTHWCQFRGREPQKLQPPAVPGLASQPEAENAQQSHKGQALHPVTSEGMYQVAGVQGSERQCAWNVEQIIPQTWSWRVDRGRRPKQSLKDWESCQDGPSKEKAQRDVSDRQRTAGGRKALCGEWA